MKTFSIIMATYNSGKTLRRCLDSIVLQKGDDCELLVVDGGSSDDTLRIIADYRDFIDYTVSEPDKGVYDAWNKALKQATGTWVTYIGSDDVLCSGSMQAYRDFFAEHGEDYDLICAKTNLLREDGSLIRVIGEPWNWKRLVYRSWQMAHPGMLHRRSLYAQHGFYNTAYRICADSEFLLHVGPNIRAAFVDRVMVDMQVGGLSSTDKAIMEGYLCRKRLHVGNQVVNLLILLNRLLRRKAHQFCNFLHIKV